MAKHPETVLKLSSPIKREKGYMYYLLGDNPKDGIITKIARSKMKYMMKE